MTDMIVYVHYGSCKNGVCIYTYHISSSCQPLLESETACDFRQFHWPSHGNWSGCGHAGWSGCGLTGCGMVGWSGCGLMGYGGCGLAGWGGCGLVFSGRH